jgi:hypothetical protein
MRGKQDIPVSDEEFNELIQLNCIEIFTSDRTADGVSTDIAAARSQYNSIADSIRQINKDILAAEREHSTGSVGVRLGAALKFGAGKEIKSRTEQLKKALEAREQEIGLVKKQLLDLSVEKETVERAVRIDGHRALLTPIGERLTGEINVRSRLSGSDLLLVTGKLAQLDNAFSSAISRIDAMMKTSTFPSVWAPYFIGLGIPGQDVESYKLAQVSSYSYDTIDEDTQLLDYSTTRMLRGVYGSGTSYTGAPNVGQVAQDVFGQINNMLSSKTAAPPQHARQVVGIIAKMLAGWSPTIVGVDPAITNLAGRGESAGNTEASIVTDPNEYLNNLYRLLTLEPTGVGSGSPVQLDLARPRDQASPAMDPANEQDEVLAVLLLALTKNPKKYEYFLDAFQSITHGRKMFAAIASLFPWDTKETWMVLLRAESSIQREQSAKFVPELIEYAMLLSLNPEILAIENNISAAQLAAWKYIAIPAIQAVVIGGLEGRIESYIRARPLSYVTYPRYYHRRYMHTTSLHYHTTG